MKKIIFAFTTIFFLQLIGCSQEEGASKLIGRWKSDTDIPNIEVIYEFTETDLKIEMTGMEMPHQNIETTYSVILDNGKTLSLEVVHPYTKTTGIFTLTFGTDTTAILTAPDGQPIRLVRSS
jgi:hypothetical protein